MKTNELRIGNYIHHNIENSDTEFIGNELIVCELDEKTIVTYYRNLNGNKQIVRYKSNYLPIPLTEEWLLKFGFEKDNSTYSWSKIIEDEQKQLSIDIESYPNERNCFWYLSKHFNQIKFVHQLQNLYFVLTGEELTIKS